MDIGTAKPSKQERARVPHWGLDLVDPGQSFTAADFKQYALEKISEIRSRHHVPLLVGGTGLYIDGVIFDYQFAPPNPILRQSLSSLSLDTLLEYCANNNIKLPENHHNKRYVMRAIERQTISIKGLSQPIAHTAIVGITTERDILRQQIATRAHDMFTAGMVEEAVQLGRRYGWDSEAMTGNIYPLVHQFVDGIINKEQLMDKFITADWRLAKRQLTWLKRNPFIVWKTRDEAYTYIKNILG